MEVGRRGCGTLYHLPRPRSETRSAGPAEVRATVIEWAEGLRQKSECNGPERIFLRRKAFRVFCGWADDEKNFTTITVLRKFYGVGPGGGGP